MSLPLYFCIYFALILPFHTRANSVTHYSSMFQSKCYKTIIFINGFIIMFGYRQKWLKISISVKMTCLLRTNFGLYFALFLPFVSYRPRLLKIKKEGLQGGNFCKPPQREFKRGLLKPSFYYKKIILKSQTETTIAT